MGNQEFRWEVLIKIKRFRGQRTKLGYVFILLSCLLALNLVSIPNAEAQGGYDPTLQTQTLLYDEARAVYLGNLARRDNGVPPLRWNLQLTHAARWFSWDSTENHLTSFCGHQDTQGHWPGDRAIAFGYLGGAGAENAYCGYMFPESAIQGWMNSSGHRANLLDPNSREIGLGYYRRNSDGHGYVTQDFGNDAVYAPVVIENEAISTTNPDVNLYIYDRSTGGGFAGLGAATQMMVSNSDHFDGAVWEQYNANKVWTLANGDGWREVYVKTRDKFNRSLTVSDTIYLGGVVPLNELGAAQMSTTQSQVTLYNLDGGPLPQVQFSLGWLADDTFGSFGKLWGNGERITDTAAWGGTAYRLYPGDGESFAWVYDTAFIKNTPLVAYFRLKVSDNTSSSEVARFSILGGSTEYGPISLKGTDFTAPNQYQEFALNFTFGPTSQDPFLIFKFWRSGTADLYVDAVSIFSAPQAVTSPLTWSVPGRNYRGQGVWVRYTDGSQFSDISEADTTPYTISGNTGAAGVTLSYVDGTIKTVISQADGSYSLTVPYNWNGTVTPSLSGVTFTPANRSYPGVTSDQTEQNFAASVVVSGNTGVGGVTLDYIDGTHKTFLSNESGNYAITVPYGWTGTVTPNKAGYMFYPSRYTYTGVIINQSAQNYLAAKILTAPELILPPQNSHALILRPTFDWSDVANTSYYTIQISKNNTFTQIVINDISSDSTILPQKDLPSAIELYWRVRAEGPGGPSIWSEVRQFTTSTPPGIPILISPNPDAITMDYKPLFKWNQVIVPRHTEFDRYQIQISPDEEFVAPVINEDLPGISTRMFTPAVDLAANAKYYWRMRAYNTDNEVSSWSEVRSFHTPNPLVGDNRPRAYTLNPMLPAPSIVSPLSSNTLNTSQPILDWTDISGATSYIVQVSSDPGFVSSTFVVSATTVDSQYTFIRDVPTGIILYWRVLAIKGGSISNWSNIWTFRVP